MKVTIGRIVHYHCEGETYAAIVAAVLDDTGYVDLAIFGSTELKFHSARYSATGNEPDSWTWPPRA